jgi:hypothetical protein
MSLFERVSPSFYLIIPCTLHGLQRSFHNAMILVLGEGGLGTRNLLQLVHSCFDLQQCFLGDARAACSVAALGDKIVGDEEDGTQLDLIELLAKVGGTRYRTRF